MCSSDLVEAPLQRMLHTFSVDHGRGRCRPRNGEILNDVNDAGTFHFNPVIHFFPRGFRREKPRRAGTMLNANRMISITGKTEKGQR